MRVFFSVVLAAVLATGALANSQDLWDALDRAAWQVYTRDFGKLEASCSAGAYWAGANVTRILTAGHCVVNESAQYTVTRDGLNFVEAKVLARGWVGNDTSGGDWAVLEINGRHSVMPLGDSSTVKMGMSVFAVGFPIGGDKIATQGMVGNPRYRAPGTPWDGYIAASLTALPGSSGTTVVNKDGQIIGILVATAGNVFFLLTPINLVKSKVPCLQQEQCRVP